ncbi:MAG: DNA polymerase III delta subunit, partial [Candidatus Azotimanducaceae bacterium]
MYYVFYGNDTVAVRKQAHESIDGFEKKGFEVARIDSDTFSSGAIADAIGASSLFERQTLYV